MSNSLPSEINVGKPFFIAQAPGDNEIIVGKPLIGNINDRRTAGVILKEIIEKLGFSREDFSYGNTYDKHPGKKNNRDKAPSRKMQKKYAKNLFEDIISSKTKIIITLGKKAEIHLKWMIKQDKYKELRNIKIIHLPYARNNYKVKLEKKLKHALVNDRNV